MGPGWVRLDNDADMATLKKPNGDVVDRCSYNAPSKSEKACTGRLPDQAMTNLRSFHVDTTTIPGHTLLRFTTEPVNIGAGPLELRGSRPNTSRPTMPVVQRIYDAGGGFHSVSVPPNMFWAGDGHDHWHVRGFMSTELERADTGVNVGRGAKQGFCLTDSNAFNVSLPGAPNSKVYKGCVQGGQTSLAVNMGISVGWGDRYGYTFPPSVGRHHGPDPGPIQAHRDRRRTELLPRVERVEQHDLDDPAAQRRQHRDGDPAGPSRIANAVTERPSSSEARPGRNRGSQVARLEVSLRGDAGDGVLDFGLEPRIVYANAILPVEVIPSLAGGFRSTKRAAQAVVAAKCVPRVVSVLF